MQYDRLLIDAVRALAGRQVTSVTELYRLFGGQSPRDQVPAKIIDLMAQVLRDLGYVERWVARMDEPDGCAFLWVRDPWPHDHHANAQRRRACYLPAY